MNQMDGLKGMKKDTMCEIISDPAFLEKYRDCAVYHRVRAGYMLYKPADLDFDRGRIAAGRYPDKLFVSLEDRIRVVRQEIAKANRRLSEELGRDGELAREALHDVLTLTLSEPRSEILNDLKGTIDIVVDEYMTSPHVIRNLALVSAKDYATHLHLANVMLFAIGYAHHCGFSEADMKVFGLMGLLHDVGKVDVPDEILQAPRKLTDEEFALIRKHPRRSWEMLRECDFDERVSQAALEHHERLDGSGYPLRRTGDDLCAHSRALAIIDVFEALTTWRPYKEPIPMVEALKIMKREVMEGKLDKMIFAQFTQSIVGGGKSGSAVSGPDGEKSASSR